MAEFNLGRVAFLDRDVYSPTESYNKWDFVTTVDSCYLYINTEPSIGIPITNTDYWKCIADGKPSTLAAAAAAAVTEQSEQFAIAAGQYAAVTLELKNTVQGLHDTVVEDAEQVALDRIATGEDSAQTALDRIATGQDAQTATEKAQIATDKASQVVTDKNYTAGYMEGAQLAEQGAQAAEEQTLIYKNAAAAIVSGGPRGVYATAADLITANPDHLYTYVVTADGHWYYWNGSTFADGGVYQTVQDYALKSHTDNIDVEIGILDIEIDSNNSGYTFTDLILRGKRKYNITNTTGNYIDVFNLNNEKIGTIDIIAGTVEYTYNVDCKFGGIIGTGFLKIQSKDTAYNLLDERISTIESGIAETTLYANSAAGTNDATHFFGNTAIRDAIASISDNAYNKRYIIKCTGNFVATLPSHYEYDAGLAQWAMFWLKDYITLDGTDAGSCTIRASLPDTEAECKADTPSFEIANYGSFQPLFIGWSSQNIKNITFSVRNGRYPLHIDASNSVASRNQTINIEGCRLVHEGKFGDAVGTIGGSASGFGTSSGSTYNFKNCLFIGSLQSYYHDNSNFTEKSKIRFENCNFSLTNIGRTISNGIAINQISNLTGSIVEYINCNFDPYTWMDVYDVVTGIDRGDSFRADMITDMYPVPIYNHSPSMGLRVKSATQENSTVRFDQTSSAFSAIVGYPAETGFLKHNRFFRQQQYGYEYSDGGIGFVAEAIGLVNLNSIGMGARLGDCTVNNKVIGVIIDGTTYTITFNANYTSEISTNILAEINAVLGSAGVADLAYTNIDWYPSFKGIKILKVDDSTSILNGMGVVYTENGVRKALSTDDHIDGIALDNGANGTQIRIATKGGLCYNIENPWRYGVLHDGPVYHGAVPFGTKYGIGSTPGIFSPTGAVKVISKGFNESWYIL